MQYFIDSIKKSSGNRTFHLFISDNNSNDTDTIKSICAVENNITLIESKNNWGFCKGNNIAVQQALKLNSKYILFVNPDLFLTTYWLDKASQILENDTSIGVLSGPLLQFDFESKQPTGLIDSLGINVTQYGKWFDVQQEQPVTRITADFFPEAICGALMLIKREIIDSLLNTDGFIFNEKFFMYKEDVDLSLRINKLGYKLVVHPDLIAYHCRGWEKNRSKMPFLAKKLSAINDIRIALKYRLINLPFAILKLVYVYCFEYPFQK
jgi:GT2 family glycosyltransferase